jgi:hypothetical protein
MALSGTELLQLDSMLILKVSVLDEVYMCIGELQTCCLTLPVGCDTALSARALETHDKECMYKPLDCPNGCGTSAIRKARRAPRMAHIG